MSNLNRRNLMNVTVEITFSIFMYSRLNRFSHVCIRFEVKLRQLGSKLIVEACRQSMTQFLNGELIAKTEKYSIHDSHYCTFIVKFTKMFVIN